MARAISTSIKGKETSVADTTRATTFAHEREMEVSQSVLGIILGGGAGTRLYPLTKTRAKPAVPLGANYRLIDIPVSNCLNSGIIKARRRQRRARPRHAPSACICGPRAWRRPPPSPPLPRTGLIF